jgi:hypothetical protein
MDWMIVGIIILFLLLIAWGLLERKKDQTKNEQFFNDYLDKKRRIKLLRRSRRHKMLQKRH